jgi:hypothetical protein
VGSLWYGRLSLAAPRFVGGGQTSSPRSCTLPGAVPEPDRETERVEQKRKEQRQREEREQEDRSGKLERDKEDEKGRREREG